MSMETTTTTTTRTTPSTREYAIISPTCSSKNNPSSSCTISDSATKELIDTLRQISGKKREYPSSSEEEETENTKDEAPSSSKRPTKKRRDYSFNPLHAMEYGLRVVETSVPVTTDAGSVSSNCSSSNGDAKVVVAAECQFCVAFGRESSSSTTEANSSSTKKRPSKNTWYFKYPFRTTKYLQHLKGQHKEKWEHYQKLPSKQLKQQFFCTPVTHPTTTTTTSMTTTTHQPKTMQTKSMDPKPKAVGSSLPPTTTSAATTTSTVVDSNTSLAVQQRQAQIQAEKEVLEAQTVYASEKMGVVDFDHPSFQRLVHAIAKASKLGAKYLYSSDAVEGFSLGRQCS